MKIRGRVIREYEEAEKVEWAINTAPDVLAWADGKRRKAALK
jgi:hypothetical protein